MKKVTSILIALMLVSAAHGFDKRMRFVVEQLRLLDEIGGSAVGYAGTPHDFYLLYRYAAFASTDQDIDEMMRDSNPVVRIMGVKCAVTAPFRSLDRSQIDALLSDTRDVVVGPGGCVFQHMKVADVILALKKDPDFLGDGAFKRPNQSPEPTSPSVTSRADARLAPAGAVAHL